MDLKHVTILAIQVSVMVSVFGFGLRAQPTDLFYLIRRPGLLLRALLSVFVIMPIITVLLVQAFELRRIVEIALVALAISPAPPLLPRKEIKAGAPAAFGVELTALLAIAAIGVVPACLWILQKYTGRSLDVVPGTIAKIVLVSIVLPLAAGMVFRLLWPQVAQRIAKRWALIGNTLLTIAAVTILIGALPAIWDVIGQGTLLAMVIFCVVGLAIGHVLALPDRDHSVVLALSTACRHPAIAVALASANFPNDHFAATILLYLLVSAVVGIPYVRWQGRKRATDAASPAAPIT